MKTKEKQKSGDKFRQRIAFNLAKECLLGDIHDPSIPQEDLFLGALTRSNFASRDGNQVIGIRTYKSGWHGQRRPQRWLQALLDEIVQEYAKEKLSEWNARIALNKSLHERKLQMALDHIASSEGLLAYTMGKQDKIFQDSAKVALERSKKQYEALILSGEYRDGLHIGYFPGVDIKPSNWINRNAINDVLHEHLFALDVKCMDYSKENIAECNKLLNRIHERWNPHGSNCFFECMDFSQTEFIHFDEGDYLKKFVSLNGRYDPTKDAFDPHIISNFKSPDNVYQTYDVFSPAKISEFLTRIPISKDISSHPLLDFWVMDFASSVAAFYWLFEAYRRRDGYKVVPELSSRSLDILDVGNKLLWGENDIQECLCQLDIYPDSVFYNEYHNIFSLIRSKYRSILSQFGIDVSEIKDLFADFYQRNAIVFVPSREPYPSPP